MPKLFVELINLASPPPLYTHILTLATIFESH